MLSDLLIRACRYVIESDIPSLRRRAAPLFTMPVPQGGQQQQRAGAKIETPNISLAFDSSTSGSDSEGSVSSSSHRDRSRSGSSGDLESGRGGFGSSSFASDNISASFKK